MEVREVEIHVSAVREGDGRRPRKRTRGRAIVMAGLLALAAILGTNYARSRFVPVIALEGSTDFGTQAVGTGSAIHTISIANVGSSLLSIEPIVLEGSDARDFAVLSDTCSNAVIDPSTGCAIALRFTPGAEGPREASISVARTGEDPRIIPLTGSGASAAAQAALLAQPEQIAFDAGNPLGTVVLNNHSGRPLAIRSVTLGGGPDDDFAIARDDCSDRTVAPDSSCTVQVHFTARVPGPHTSTVAISYDGPGSPKIVPLSGTADPPQPRQAIARHEVELTTQAERKAARPAKPPAEPPAQVESRGIIFRNVGNQPIHVGTVTITGDHAADFAIESDECSARVLRPAAVCTVAYRFSPSGPGFRTAELVIPHDGEDAPKRIALKGPSAR